MSIALDLLLAAILAAGTALLALVLLQRSQRERAAVPAGGTLTMRPDPVANAVGFLLIGTLAAGSGLLADALCQVLQ